jgi:hypothetical protein
LNDVLSTVFSDALLKLIRFKPRCIMFAKTVDQLTDRACRRFVRHVLCILYQDPDGSFDADKEWDPDTLDAIACRLHDLLGPPAATVHSA